MAIGRLPARWVYGACAVLLGLTALGLSTRGPALLAASVPSGFTESLIASGLANPTAMEFAPDGRLFVLEQAGRVRVIKNDVLLPTPFLVLNVHTSGERGLLGIAFDPDFAANHHVYLYYTANTPTRHNRISRFTANGDVAVADSEVVIFQLDPLSSANNHNGGALHFGPDGKLYAAVGDNANNDNAQVLTSLNGKILRINKDGTIPDDNPFYATAVDKYRAIWAMGLRNPFTFAFNPSTGEMFINDVGESTWEEINLGVAGANYAWPEAEGPSADPRYQSPRFAYQHGGGSDVCAITGGVFYSPAAAQFPSQYLGDYFFADYCAGWIRRIDPADGTTTPQTFVTGLRSPVGLALAPDGSLYYLARGSGSSTGVVYRVQFGASAPNITGHPASQIANIEDTITFTVAASGTPPLSYQWQRNGMDIAGATSATFTLSSVTASDNGSAFRVVVSNAYGNVTSNEAILTVASNQPPTAAILSPETGSLFTAGSVVAYSGAGTDPEDGTLPPSAFTWQIDFHHDDHLHPHVQPTTGASSGTFSIPTTGETSANVWFRIHLTVRDADGRTHAVSRDIHPRTSRLTLESNPPGLHLKLDGQPVTTPLSFEGVVGTLRTLEAVSPQTLGGAPWIFSSWSDGGEARHDISTAPTDTTYSATFAAAGLTTILNAQFDGGPDGFVYLDDTFRGTAQPGSACWV